MSKTLLLLAGSALLFAGAAAASSSSGVLKLAKPGVSYATFMDDRSQCLVTASSTAFSSSVHSVAFTTYNFDKFSSCMRAKGYRLDPAGYRAAWYETYDGKTYALRPDVPSGL